MDENQVLQLQREVAEIKILMSEQSKTIDKFSTIIEAQQSKITNLEISRGRSEEKIDNLIEVVNSLKTDVNASLKDLSNKVETLNNKPGERWNSLIGGFVIAIGTAIATIVVSKFTGIKL